jgi:glycerol-3-phosphate dehydrogenase
LYFTIPSRAAYLLGTYERRYKKLLKQPDWSDEEIEELGPSMRTSIIQSMKDK